MLRCPHGYPQSVIGIHIVNRLREAGRFAAENDVIVFGKDGFGIMRFRLACQQKDRSPLFIYQKIFK